MSKQSSANDITTVNATQRTKPLIACTSEPVPWHHSTTNNGISIVLFAHHSCMCKLERASNSGADDLRHNNTWMYEASYTAPLSRHICSAVGTAAMHSVCHARAFPTTPTAHRPANQWNKATPPTTLSEPYPLGLISRGCAHTARQPLLAPSPSARSNVCRARQGARHEAAFYVCLSRGTTHKPPPRDDAGFPIDEATASARYLTQVHSIPGEKIIKDTW